MKRVLITGANSYVGTNVEKWLMKEPENFYIETLDMRDPNWKNFDFSKFDVVFHVAGIAHIKENNHNKFLYYQINRDLAIETAKIAKNSRVKQFIFMSTMAIYNENDECIDSLSVPKPKSSYAISKFQAEKIIMDMCTQDFKVAILRPPLIYGSYSPGNYSKLSKFIKKYRVIIKYMNIKSFIYIDNLSYFTKNIIDREMKGIFHPHNSKNTSTYNICTIIAKTHKKKVLILSLPRFILILLKTKSIKKIFGSHYYNFPQDRVEYIGLEESILLSETVKGQKL